MRNIPVKLFQIWTSGSRGAAVKAKVYRRTNADNGHWKNLAYSGIPFLQKKSIF